MPDLAVSIAQAGQSGGCTLRTGTLIAIGDTTLTVDIGGGQALSMPYIDPYIPILGDRVQVIQQGMVCLAIGAAGGMPDDNVLANPSFELDAVGTTPPSNWHLYFDPAGDSLAHPKTDVASGWGPKHGTRWLEINYAGGAGGFEGNYVWSDPVAVQPGQVWSASAYVVTAPELGADEPALQLRLAFMATSAGTYPASVISETTIQTINGPSGPAWVPLRAVAGSGTTVPAGAGAMSVVLLSQQYGGSVYWDKVVCRRLA